MGFLSKAWSGAKSLVKNVGKTTGIDSLITSLPGSGTDLANAAKIAGLAAGAYFAAPYVASYFGAGGTGALGAGSTLTSSGVAGGTALGATPGGLALDLAGNTVLNGTAGAAGGGLLSSLGTGLGTAGLLSTGLNLAGGLMSANSAQNAANTLSDAQIQAAQIAADAAKFRPVGVANRFGSSKFTYDTNGNLIGAGYTPSALVSSLQNQIDPTLSGMLSQYTNSTTTNAPLQTGAQSAYALGNQYLTTSPQQQAQKYMQDQLALLNPTRERQLAGLMTTLQNQGRTGLAVGATSDGLHAANPELEAYYNALMMQDRQLAADATQGGMNYANFGTNLLNQGSGLMSGFYGNQANSLVPFNAGLSADTTLEGLAQTPLDLGINIGAKGTAANATSGLLLGQGMSNAAKTMYPTNAYNPWAYATGMLGQTIGQNYQNPQQQPYRWG